MIPPVSRPVRLAALLLTLASGLPAAGAEPATVEAFVADLAREHGFEPAALSALLADAEAQPGIIERISRPAERTLSWAEYRRIFLGAERIAEGVRFVAGHRRTLDRAEARFGVPPAYVAAILGVETRYGTRTGDWRVLDALYTLAFDHPPRADFFRGELEQFLLLAREEGRDARRLRGSYAGAMGWGQFIPSSFRAYAVDFDGDGIRDIWSDPVDAIGSVANYFAEHGWRAGGPVLRPVALRDPAVLERLANRGLELGTSVGELRRLGVDGLGSLPDATPAGLWRVEGEQGAEVYATFGNFRTITRYNHSHLYALAVHDLAEAIAAGHGEGPAR